MSRRRWSPQEPQVYVGHRLRKPRACDEDLDLDVPEEFVLHGQLAVGPIGHLPTARHEPGDDVPVGQPRADARQPPGQQAHQDVQADVHPDRPVEPVEWGESAPRTTDLAAVLGQKVPPPRDEEELLEVVNGLLLEHLFEPVVPAEVFLDLVLAADRQAQGRHNPETAEAAADRPGARPRR